MTTIPTREEILDGELFADLQQSLTDIFLLESLPQRQPFQEKRLATEKEILNRIKTIMQDRFSVHDIKDFLEDGYPRLVRINRVNGRI